MKYTVRILAAAAAMAALVFSSCDKTPEEEPKPDPGKEDVYPTPATPSDPVSIKLIPGNMNQMTCDYNEASDTYIISTSGTDPYVFTEKLGTLKKDICVLTFEYTSDKDIDDFQIYYCNPLAEGRSGHFGVMKKTSGFKEFNCNLKSDMAKFSWGYSSHFMRLDFGHVSGNKIQIKGLKLRPMNEAEQAEYDRQQANATGKAAMAERLASYLQKNYSSSVTSVKVGQNDITISGKAGGASGYFLAEITPYEDITEMKSFAHKTEITSSSFTVTLPRTESRDGFTYDRLLSKWAVVKGDVLDSHARYADEEYCNGTNSKYLPTTKKGLGGFYGPTLQIQDLDALGITSVTVNIVLNALINTEKTGKFTLNYQYGGKTYYISTSEQNSLDKIMKACASRGIIVSAILLDSANNGTQGAALMNHPDRTGGNYSMQNITTAESFTLFAAVIDYLASRYNGGTYGMIHHWIVHNEIDFGTIWTNMGDQPEMRFIDTYIKIMRICGLIAGKYNPVSSPLISLTHCWTKADGEYAPKNLLSDLNAFSAAEGDFYWGVAYHPYPQDLTRPEFWKNDTKSTYSLDSQYCTFKNLEVVSAWVKQKENLYKGQKKRILFLSENGTNSPSYSENDMKNQAAGGAWALKKVYALDGIDAIQWHNWMDNRYEDGLRIGLRRFSDDAQPSAAKPVWYVYQAAGTAKEAEVFDPYLQTIGITSWDAIFQSL